MSKHWSGEFEPSCVECGRSPEEIPGKITPEKLEEFGWIQSGAFGDWLCQACDCEMEDEGGEDEDEEDE